MANCYLNYVLHILILSSTDVMETHKKKMEQVRERGKSIYPAALYVQLRMECVA